MGTYRSFGLTLESEFELPGMRFAERVDGPAVALRLASADELESVWSGGDAPPTWEARFPDGQLLRVDTGSDGDQRFRFGSLGDFWLSPTADWVICAPQQTTDPEWQRFLLDTVLWWTAARRGYCLLHACGLDHRAGVVAFASWSGGGKTTLALELLRRGWPLFCDDVLVLHDAHGELTADPGPPLMNVPSTAEGVAAFGQVLAELGDETWLSVTLASTDPRPLGALFLYSRNDGGPLSATPARVSVLELLPHLFMLSGQTDRAQFNLIADLVEQVPIFHLSAPKSAPPAAVVRVVESALEESLSHA